MEVLNVCGLPCRRRRDGSGTRLDHYTYDPRHPVPSIGGRFLWVRDISRPDFVVGVLATLFTLAATASGSSGPAPNRIFVLLLSAVLTAVALSKMAAGVGLYWAVSSLIGAAQGLVVQRHARTAA